MHFRKHISFILVLFCAGVVLGQKVQWTLNPKALNDTLDLYIYPKDSKIYVSHPYDSFITPDNYYWISSFSRGLLRMDINNGIQLRQNAHESFDFDKKSAHNLYYFEDTLYVGNERGFMSYDPSKEKFHSYGSKDLSNLSPYKCNVHCMEFISSDTVLIGNKQGLCLFDKREDRIIKKLWDENPKKDGAATYDFVHELRTDQLDSTFIWGVGRKVLFRLSTKNWSKEYYDYADGIDKGSVNYYMTDFVQVDSSLYVVYCGDVISWTQKGNQLLKFDLKTQTWSLVARLMFVDKFDKTYYSPLHSLKRIGDYLLIASRSNGVQLVDLKTDELHQLYFRHPMFSQMDNWKNPNRLFDFYLHGAYSANIDNHGYLWVATLRDYIAKSEKPLFNPSLPRKKPKIVMNNLYVNGSKFSTHKFSQTDKPNSFSFNQRERDVAFDFGIVNPIDHNIRYEYKYGSSDWQSPLSERLIRINELKPGKNNVFVRAMIKDKVYNSTNFELYAVPRLHERWWFVLGVIMFLSSVFYLLYRSRIDKIRSEERLRTKFQRQVAEVEMEALRAQMNPHFLFNSLNSIKHYALTKSKDETAEYLTTFSLLIRQVLQNSKDKVITLAQELDAIKLYVEVEQLRFEDRFEFEFEVDPSLNVFTIYIPPLLLQPYVENAIWHGLMHLKRPGKLKISIEEKEEKLICVIEDNGIGREKAMELKKAKGRYKKKSLGMRITSDRLKWVKEIYGVEAEVNIIDIKNERGNPKGTKVMLALPKIDLQTIEKLRNQ